MIKNVFVDLDDTIFDFKKGERDALSRALISNGVNPDDNMLLTCSRINDIHWKMLEKGIITKKELNSARFRAFFGEFNIDLSADEFCLEYENNLAEEYFFIDGAEEFLKNLYGRYRLYAASNGYIKTQRSRLMKSGIEHFFEDVFISQEVGYDKPAKEFFDVSFSRISGFDRNESVIIGDSLTSDIMGGKNAGIKTIRLMRNEIRSEEIIPDYEVYSLSEAIKIIESL